ncbi:MAG: hypothetical protein ACRD68_15535, partial [Pyrinomonadaceae bacterium]
HSAQVTYQATSGNGQFGTLAQLRTSDLIDDVLGGDGTVTTTTKSGYNFTAVPVAGANPAQFYATAFPTVVSATMARTGDRRFAIAEDSLLRGDTSITTAIPNRAAVSSMSATPN